ncbi:MAG: PfkB family carbohydrate kinase, partial [Pseudomonadota bacterium]
MQPSLAAYGAANCDTISRCGDEPISGASNPATTVQYAGGAALNVVSVFAALGGLATLNTALGDDAAGAFVRRSLRERSVALNEVSCQRTGSYTAICGPDGTLALATSDMAGIEGASFGDATGSVGWTFIEANLCE